MAMEMEMETHTDGQTVATKINRQVVERVVMVRVPSLLSISERVSLILMCRHDHDDHH